jgi:hypothetical protein
MDIGRRGRTSAEDALNGATTAVGETVAVYAIDSPGNLALPVWPFMHKKVGYQSAVVYTAPETARADAVADISARQRRARCRSATPCHFVRPGWKLPRRAEPVK